MTWSATLEVAVAPSNDLIVLILIGFVWSFLPVFTERTSKRVVGGVIFKYCCCVRIEVPNGPIWFIKFYCLSLIVCSWPLVKLCETSLSTSDHHCPLCYFLFRHCNLFLANHEQISEDDLQFRTSIAMPNPCQSISNDFHPNLILQNLTLLR